MIFTISLVPSGDWEDFIVSAFDKELAISFNPWAPFVPVKVFAFFVFTKSPFIKCLLIFKFQFILAEVIFEVVYTAPKLAPSLK